MSRNGDRVDGGVSNTTGVWATFSDRRLKKDIVPIKNALATVSRLRGVSFNWKDSSKDARHGKARGLIAQEVERVVPEWVKTGSDGYKSVETIGMDAVLIEAIKELKAQSDRQQTEIESLRAELRASRKR